MNTIILGIDRLTADRTLAHRRVGLLAHPASVNRRLRHTLATLKESGAQLEILFGPEHGFSGEAQDMEPVPDRKTHPSGLPLVSLYGDTAESLAPSKSDLTGLDAMVVDLMDVGARYYTFVWTALLALRACHKAGVEMYLADRPNPISGVAVEGSPHQHPDFLSFVGLKPIANRHGLTMGEILTLAAKEEGLLDALTVVRMTGWRRDMFFDETGHPFVPPSPNMPTLETALVYPGMCLLEGTWASEGRGTTKPFELFGAPGVDSTTLAKRMTDFTLPGVRFRPATFKPGFQKHHDRLVGGVQIHVTDRRRFLPYKTGVAALLALKREMPSSFEWRHAPYEFVSDRPAIDLLTGSGAVREIVDNQGSLADAEATWKPGEISFVEQREDYLLY